MGEGSGLTSGARIVHNGANELRKWQDSVPDGENTPPIEEGTQHTHRLSSPLPHLIDVRRPGESCIEDYPQIKSSLDPFIWFPEECYRSGLNQAPSSTREDNRGAFGNINGDSPFTQPPLKIVEVCMTLRS